MIESNPIQNNPSELPDALAIKKSAIILRAVNHKLRQQILKLLLEKKSLTVTEIFTGLFLEQAVASQHLAVLRRAGFVKTKREGKLVRYSINPQRLLQVQQVIEVLL
jgi:DNA-binding transcriptional ArsR family regulator